MLPKITLLAASFFTLTLSTSIIASTNTADDSETARGKYLLVIGGCNDCHTTGYAASGGTVAEAEWLSGDALGFRGPWGTTYPINLREYFTRISVDDWVARARNLQTKPPMPWWVLNAMSDDDLRALHKYIDGLGPVAKTVPGYIPPGMEPETPYIQWPEAPQ